MIEIALNRLWFLVETIPPLLSEIDEEVLSAKPGPGRWSKKEIIGHLIDSATNNHHRFVRGQFENVPLITYNQDQWNNFGYYQHMESALIVSFWAGYNRQLAELISNIPEELLLREVDTGSKSLHTIAWLINDYVKHLEHHLKQVIDYTF